ncbi:hypothetical protein WH47_04229 [Habropoda laboriosa]|uniref:SANTA domain-containing protein n=2 Tax=Habropoda laboriosa TaxID=597456 RepID=A0A0L7QVA1_9HYME|nr:hypothetical protein WH47_04229 [Habropoda laboriosa]
MKFGDLQVEQRNKKLERILKIASLKEGISKGDESWSSHKSPSISRINLDQYQSTTNTSYSQDFNISSDVVSSSNNLRNILLQRKRINRNHKVVSTSSVKKFSEESDCQSDHFLMPTHTLDKVFRSSKKSDNNVTYNVTKYLLTSQSKCPLFDINKESLKRKQKYKSCNDREKYINTFSSLQIPSDTCPNRKVTIFTKWKVMLNEQSQLIIRGMLECGKIAQSKPIMKRLTSTNIESIYEHLYCLQGNIVDDECELPDYIRSKFYNGFPDDWENVCQSWKTFLQGCSRTFRWPTPITDSDDDLKTEVTDITFACANSPEDGILNLKSFKESHISRASAVTNCSCNILEMKDKQDFNSNSYKKCDSFTQTYISDITENSSHQVDIEPSKKQYNNDKENCIHQEDKNLNYSRIRNEENGLKDKLSLILNNLTDKNCSHECISKVIEILEDCLNYVVTCGSSKEDTFNIKSSKLEGNNERNHESLEYCQSESSPLENNIGKIIDTSSVLRRKRTFAEMNEANSSSTSDSENEVYAGVPKISMKRMIRRKKELMKPYKRKLRKKVMHQKYDIAKERRTLDVFPTISNCTKQSYRKSIRSKDTNGINFDDSSISIIEDEKNDFAKLRSNNDEHVKSDILKSRQWEKSNDFMKNKTTHEMQEHFVKEKDFTATCKPTKHFCPSHETTENQKHEINMSTKRKNKMREMSLSVDTGNKKESENIKDQYQKHLSCQQYEEFSTPLKNDRRKTPSPVIIRSVPVHIDITKKNSKCSPQNRKIYVVENKDKTINELIKNESVMERESPRKSDTIKKSNLNSLTDSKQYSKENNSTTLKILSPANLKMSENNKPKLLSAWRPIVLSDSGLQLIFKGDLLNEDGHIVHTNFTTNKVLHRISLRLIETIHHEFYHLIGELNDTKHAVPKELLSQCHYGCPSRIELFCKRWKLLESAVTTSYAEMMEGLNNTSMINGTPVAISSKGRKIMRPLNYWTGERIIFKDDNVIYKPGNSSDCSMLNHGSPNKSKHVKNSKQEIRNKSKAENLYESEVPIVIKKSYNLKGKRDMNREVNTLPISPSKQM